MTLVHACCTLAALAVYAGLVVLIVHLFTNGDDHD